jgi:hypothetical protein
MGAPCGWTVTDCGCGSGCWSSTPPAAAAYAADTAAAIMWAATGRRYGQCAVTVEPCTRGEETFYQTYPLAEVGAGSTGPYISGGIWHNSCGGGSCGCSGRCEVALAGPTSTAAITAVTVAGVIVPPAAYVVYDGYLLTRVDGGCWPTCRDYSDPATAFTVEYLRGDPIPDHVQAAFERLACELAKACTGGDCALPQRVRSMTRQGVEIQMVDLADEAGRIRTGIATVDQIIEAENPRGLQQRPSVLSPDLPAPRMVT